MNQQPSRPLIVLSAPSGAGKTTIARRILNAHPRDIIFSVSATTREKREGESDGVDYFFLTKEKFEELIAQGGFIEFEKIFGNYYGTPVSEVDRARTLGKRLLFDIDVKGGLSIKNRFPDKSLLIFIAPPSLDVLKKRLESRGTDSAEVIERRLARAEMEMTMSSAYDHVVVNDDLERAIHKVESLIFSMYEGNN